MRKCSWIITDRLDFPEVPKDCFLLFWKFGAEIRTEVWVKNSESYFGVIFVIFCTKSAVTTNIKIKWRFVVPWGQEVCLDDWSGLWWLDPLASWFLVICYYTYLVNILIYRANTLLYLFIPDSEGENITVFQPLFYLHVIPYFCFWILPARANRLVFLCLLLFLM